MWRPRMKSVSRAPVPGAAVQLRLVREIVDHDQNLVKLLEAQLLRGPGDLLLLLDDGAKGSLVPLVEVDLLPLRVDAHVCSMKPFTGFHASSISIEGLKM